MSACLLRLWMYTILLPCVGTLEVASTQVNFMTPINMDMTLPVARCGWGETHGHTLLAESWQAGVHTVLRPIRPTDKGTRRRLARTAAIHDHHIWPNLDMCVISLEFCCCPWEPDMGSITGTKKVFCFSSIHTTRTQRGVLELDSDWIRLDLWSQSHYQDRHA